jgi:hypothetical protein
MHKEYVDLHVAEGEHSFVYRRSTEGLKVRPRCAKHTRGADA